MIELLPEERETHLNMVGDDHGTWIVFSDDPYWMRRLDRIAEVVRVTGVGKEYRLDANQVIIKAKPKPLSPERKEQLAKQAQNMRKPLVITRVFDPELAELAVDDL
jgi:hypothetical protein